MTILIQKCTYAIWMPQEECETQTEKEERNNFMQQLDAVDVASKR